MTRSQQIETENKFDKTVHFLQRQYGINKSPGLKYTSRKSRTAGFFSPKDNVITINTLFYHNNAEGMINMTVPHEIAHAFTHYKFFEILKRRVSAHGSEWASVMRVLGLPAQACNTYDSVEDYYVTYCRCRKEVKVGKIQYGKIMRGKAYQTRCCKMPLIKSTPFVLSTLQDRVEIQEVNEPEINSSGW